MGERKTASIRRLRKGETSRGPREQRPAACKKQAAESNNEVTSNFPWTATLEAKRAGWSETGLQITWNHFGGWSPGRVRRARSRVVSMLGLEGGSAGMSERAYLLIVSVVFLLFTLGNVLQFIFIPWALEPAWPGPHCCCCHRLFVVRRVPLRAQVATEGMKSWHGCRLSSSARGPCEPLRVPCTSVILRGCREGELVPAARAAAPCDVRARPFACAAEMQLAIPE